MVNVLPVAEPLHCPPENPEFMTFSPRPQGLERLRRQSVYRYRYISLAQPRSIYRHAVSTIRPGSWYSGTHPSTSRAMAASPTTLGQIAYP